MRTTIGSSTSYSSRIGDDLLSRVRRHEAGRPAVLVEHDRDVDLAPLELVEEVVTDMLSGTKTGTRRASRGGPGRRCP
jgi:hypothetical protein